MVTGIYQIINLITNKFYIGSSIDIKARWSIHKHRLNKNKHDNVLLQFAWNKYGSNAFEFKLLELCDKEDLIKIEQKWLDKTKCYARNIGYNINSLANSVVGLKWSDESRQRFSEKKKGFKASFETRTKMSITRKSRGHIHSAILKGRKQSEEWKNKKALANRKFDKWPCADGKKCKCQICMNTRRLDQQKYRKKLRESAGW